MVAAATGVSAVPAAMAQATATVAVGATAGTATALPGYLIQTSKSVSDDAAVSKPGFPATGWYPVSARSTVYAGLLQNNKYPDPFYSTRMKDVPASDFTVPWWYR